MHALTLCVFIGQKFVLHQFPQDLVAASVFQAGDGGQQTDGDDLMVFHPHLHLSQQQVQT